MAKSISMFWLRTSSQEMKLVKYDLLTWKLPQTVRDGKLSRTEWVMQQRFSYQGHFPLMISVVGALLFIPVSNARPKRGASKVKLIKNRLRSLLKGDMLNSLMHISLNGPSVTSEEGQQVIKDSVVPGWLLKNCKKLPSVSTATGSSHNQSQQNPVPTHRVLKQWLKSSQSNCMWLMRLLLQLKNLGVL